MSAIVTNVTDGLCVLVMVLLCSGVSDPVGRAFVPTSVCIVRCTSTVPMCSLSTAPPGPEDDDRLPPVNACLGTMFRL
jgi:hypothetical protein